jgi:DNA modification methylase
MTALVLRGDARHLPLDDETVDLIVTSPPYYKLRSYTDGGAHYDGQIGSEATLAGYIAALVACTAEWVRVLKPSGSIFVILGDKHATHWSSRSEGSGFHHDRGRDSRGGRNTTGVPEKSLLGLPWRYALACIGHGSALDDADLVKLLLRDVALGVIPLWAAEQLVDELAATPGEGLGLTLRAEIIWAKPNGMPESVTDRVRRSHEQVFHLTRRARYYSAVDEIREPHVRTWVASRNGGRNGWDRGDHLNAGLADAAAHPLGKLPDSVWDIASQPLVAPAELGIDHFAAFPMELPRRIIRGWSPPAICTECGEGRRPVMAMTGYACACTPYTDHPERRLPSATPRDPGSLQFSATVTGKQHAWPERQPVREYHLEAWTPPPTRPAVVVDPCGGTGTTALLADVLGRIGITVDRSADYCRYATWRTTDPGERARAMQVSKPPAVAADQGSLFDRCEVSA